MVAYDGLLLDHDGVVATLSDRELLRAAARTALHDAGVADPDRSAVRTLTVRVDEDALVGVGRRYGVDPDDLWRHRDDRVRDVLFEEIDTGRKKPYADAGALDRVTRPMGIVSNNQTRIVERVLARYGLRELFGTVRARTPDRASLARKKPEPTYLEAAMADLGIENPLYVGDSESDVVAGHRAGVDTAFIRRPHNADRGLDAAPTHETDGLDGVVDLLGGPDLR